MLKDILIPFHACIKMRQIDHQTSGHISLVSKLVESVEIARIAGIAIGIYSALQNHDINHTVYPALVYLVIGAAEAIGVQNPH